jgi:hypothetical protein
MTDDRYYTAGTTEALFMLSRGYCYFPSCQERVMRWSGNGWRIKVQISHIKGRHKNSARFDESVPEPERNSFRNLLLLCKMHHDLVDSRRTAHQYPEELLMEWKAAREGCLADELDVLDWITRERLEELLASAIDQTMETILEGIGHIKEIGSETLALLKNVVTETLRLPYLDPEDIASLEYSATIFKSLPDIVPTLHESARGLSGLPDHAYMLDRAARNLPDLPDHAYMLDQATRRLENLGDNAGTLYRAVMALQDSPLTALIRQTGELNSAASRLEDATRAALSLASQVEGVDLYPDSDAGSDYDATPAGSWTWRSFWWGFSVCCVFVIAVLSLWAYSVGHK